MFDCKRGSCGKRGNLYTLQKHEGDAPEVRALNTPVKVVDKRVGLDKFRPYEEALEKSDVAKAYLTKRGLTLETAKAWHLGFKTEKGRDILMIPYITRDGFVADVKYRALDPNASPKYWRKGGGDSILFGEHILPPKSEQHPILYMVEGEIDAMTLWQHGFAPVVSTTAGAATFKPRWYDLIKDYAPERVVVCYDSDVAGQNGATEIAKKFDEFEVVNVVLPVKDANEFFGSHSVQDFKDLVASVQPPEIENIRHISSVFDELETQLFLGETAFVGLPSVHSELNSLINGGYWNGFVITVSGVSGTGKTTFVLQDLIAAAVSDIPSYMLCLEMPEVMMLRKVVEHKFHIPMDKQSHADIQRARKQLEQIPFWMGSKVRDLDSMEKAVRQAVKRYGLRVMAFDNINYFARDPQNQHAQMEAAMKRLKELAMDLNIPIILIAQPNKAGSNTDDHIMRGNDMKGSGSVLTDSDVVVLLHRKRRATKANDFGSSDSFKGNQSPLTLIRVDKARYSPGGEFYLYFNGATSTYRSLTQEERDAMRGGGHGSAQAA